MPMIRTVALMTALSCCCAGQAATSAPEPRRETSPQTTIDDLAFARLKKLGIEPAEPCTDAVFLRRAFLDLIGTIPTPKEAREFLLDKSPNKRRALVDRLLEREEFADYWAMRWSDVLRIKAEFPINLWPNAAMAYYRWVHTCIKGNMPYDQFARELLTSSGSNFRVPAVNFYRAMQAKDPETLAKAVALCFLGERAEKWPKARFDAMATLFSEVGFKGTQEWKEEIIFFDRVKAAKQDGSDALKAAAFPDGTPAKLTPDKDPRQVFADWLIRPENPWFARAHVNRVWFWLLGRGIVQEPDDIRPDNPPANPELLDQLAKDFVACHYDFRQLCRLICNSRVYQLSAIPKTKDPAGQAHFAYYAIRRLDAEVLIDAIDQITGTGEEYSSAIPEPFTWIPDDRRSIALPDGSITSSFLELFGRPPRDTGLLSERNNTPTPDQRLHILNSSHVRRKISESKILQPIIHGGKSTRTAATELYLTILSRFPTEKELAIVRDYSQTGEARGEEALVDLAWALFNSAEFLYRH